MMRGIGRWQSVSLRLEVHCARCFALVLHILLTLKTPADARSNGWVPNTVNREHFRRAMMHVTSRNFCAMAYTARNPGPAALRAS